MDRHEMIRKLENAVNKGDIKEIDKILADFKPDISFDPTEVFAAKIKQKAKGEIVMKKKLNLIKTTVIAGGIAAVSCVSVCAAYTYKNYAFEKNGNFYTITSNKEMENEEYIDAVNDFEANEKPDDADIHFVTPDEYDRFESIEEAEKKYNMNICMPSVMPDLALDDITGLQKFYSKGSCASSVWINYGNVGSKEMCIFVEKKDIKDSDDLTLITKDDVDEGTLKEYKSKNGLSFKMFDESKDDKSEIAKVAYISKGSYEYALSFLGFDENEIIKIIDSIDI